MEAFSLLKYWRGGGGSAGFINGGGSGGRDGQNGGGGGGLSSTTSPTIVKDVSQHTAETDDDDDGPFFDLEFAVEEEGDAVKNDGTNNEENQSADVSSRDNGTDEDGEEEEEEEEEGEFNFTISSNSTGNDRTDSNLTLSGSDDLFFNGKLVPIEPSSLVFNSAEPNSKPPQFPVSLLKSATKFRVAMLGFKKSKQNASEKTEPDEGSVPAANAVIPDDTTPKQQQQQESRKRETEKEKQSKFFTVKFKVEEVPIVSLFLRDNNSSRKSEKHSVEDSASSDEKKFSKDVMQKYLQKVKPLYVRVSKRYGGKLKFSGQLSLGSGAKAVQSTPPTAGGKTSPPKPTADKSPPETDDCEIQVTKNQKQANIPERLRVVRKQLGKSRSASSAVTAAPPQPTVSRRDDSLLQQQDGIQSAILHCKKSFNAFRDSESSILPRSVSDPSHQKSVIDSSRKSSDEGKDCSFEP